MTLFRFCSLPLINHLRLLLRFVNFPAMFRMSGRDIRDVCQQAERSWASKVRNLNPLFCVFHFLSYKYLDCHFERAVLKMIL